MKKIKIFLGSSISEFEKERNELELFIRNISDRFEDNYNIKIVPLRCENMDNHLRRDGTQNAINEELVLDSDMCFFIFFTKAGEFTQQEFEVAFEKFRKDGKPKIYIYFKNLKDGEKAEDSVREFMNRIDNELSHYHGTFDHIDTIKLRILLNLKLQEMDFVSVEFENGNCVVDGKNALDISNVSEFANNALLQQLQKELAEIEEEYFQMKPVYAKGGASESFCRKYAETASKRQNLIDTIEELQKNIFNMSLRICKDEVHGEITARQKEAYRLFELGDYEGCMSVLDAEEIDNDFFAFEKQEEQKLKKRAGIYIKEHKTAIDILMTMVYYKNRFNEIEERYDKIVKVAEKYLVELDVICDYAIYLENQNKYKKALQTAQELESIYDDNPSIANNYDKSYLYNLLGLICRDMSSMKDSTEHYLKKALEIREELVKENPDRFNADLAISYNNAGVLYNAQGNAEKAEYYYKKAIEIRGELVKENHDRFNSYLAKSYNNAGVFYDVQGNAEKAEYYYKKAIEIYEAIAKEDPDRFNADLAQSYNNAGIFYYNQGNAEKAEYYYEKAIEIREELAKENPDRFNADLAMSYNNAGAFYDNQGNAEKAEYYYKKSIEIWEELAEENPDRFNADLAMCYNNSGVFYNDQGDEEKAEYYYEKAIEIREELAEENPDRFNADLASSCNNAGIFYENQGNAEKAEYYYIKALEIRKELAKENPDRFNANLAVSYFNYALFSDDNQYLDKAYQIAKHYPDNRYCKKIIDYVEGD
ncbi:MAG: tetratricopeptide repeat protein [Ruminococcus sp.]